MVLILKFLWQGWAFSPAVLGIYLVGLADVRKYVLLFRCGNRGEYLYLGFCFYRNYIWLYIWMFYYLILRVVCESIIVMLLYRGH